jgi:OmpA-OmpF porin, OOP family
MKTFFNRAIFAVAALSLAACSTGMELKNAQSVQPGGTVFERSLYKEYMEQATDEYNEADFANSDTFALRGIAAAQRKAADPEPVSNRNLPAGTEKDLSAARKRLTIALIKTAREKAPRDAARAQVMYECWMEEQEENVQPKDIAACRAAFEAAMKKVDAALKPKPMAKKAAPKPAPKMVMPGPFMVYFDFDSAKINLAAEGAVDRIAAAAKKAKAGTLVLQGHADLSGESKYNTVLSKERVDAVATALIGAGIAPSSITKSIHGEELPDVKTEDGVREWRNRRVAVTFK